MIIATRYRKTRAVNKLIHLVDKGRDGSKKAELKIYVVQ